jgi:hypothetical protein
VISPNGNSKVHHNFFRIRVDFFSEKISIFFKSVNLFPFLSKLIVWPEKKSAYIFGSSNVPCSNTPIKGFLSIFVNFKSEIDAPLSDDTVNSTCLVFTVLV